MPIDVAGEPYICRVVPSENAIHFEWLGEKNDYRVYCRVRETGEYSLVGETDGTEFDITGLETETDYEFFVSYGENRSRIRLARTGFVVGTVINYLHPDDKAYTFSGRYLASPSLLRLPDGALLASMDIFEWRTAQDFTLVFRSEDNGATWHYACELIPCFWGKLFLHRGVVYMLSVDAEYGSLLIGKSTDGGRSFSAPVALLRGCNGREGYDNRNFHPGVHKSPQNILIYNGRLYESLEWYNGSHNAMVMSIDVDLDPMVPENWHFTGPARYSGDWPGTATGDCDTMEGTLCVAPDGKLYNVMRYIIYNGEPKYGLTLAYRVNTEDPDAPLEFSHVIRMNCNNSKFMIKYDEVSRRYYTIASEIYDENLIHARNVLTLFVSDDMEHWTVLKRLYDFRHEDSKKVGLQYVDYCFEGDDIIFVCRTAMNGAHSYHDSNYSTFHTVKNFRSLVPEE